MANDHQLIFDKLFHHYGPQHWWPADTVLEMMLGSILVQNTNWRNADKALQELGTSMDPEVIHDMPVEELAGFIRSSGFYNIKAKRIKAFIKWFRRHHYDVEGIKKMQKQKIRDELLQINGIGRETADAMLLYAFDKPVFIVDAYARRIFYRLGYDMPSSYDAFRKQMERQLPRDLQLYNEFHALIVEHAKQLCKVKPLCDACPLLPICDQRLD